MNDSNLAIAYHEAGHAVAACLLGIKVRAHRLWGPAIVAPDVDIAIDWDGENDFVRCAIATCAGYVAQCHFDPSAKGRFDEPMREQTPPNEFRNGMDEDLECAENDFTFLTDELRNAENAPVHRWDVRRYIERTEEFLADKWPAVEAVAKDALIFREPPHVEISITTEIMFVTDEDAHETTFGNYRQWREENSYEEGLGPKAIERTLGCRLEELIERERRAFEASMAKWRAVTHGTASHGL
jgi:hypothetical protein